MTYREMKEFAESQVAWYAKQIETDSRWIKDCTKKIAESRKNDREVAAAILADDRNSETIKSLFRGDYQSSETRDLLNERRRLLYERKKYTARLNKYRNDVEKYSKLMAAYEY